MQGRVAIKDYLRESRVTNSRIVIAGVAIVVLVLLLFIRLVYLQIFSHRYYATLSQENRVNPVPIQPARGLILDRNGVVLAQNFPVFTLEIVPDRVKDMDALIKDLGKLVALTDKDIKSFLKQMRERPRYEHIVLRSNLTEEESARIALQRLHYNGVELKARLQRHYPFGGLGVHAIGYVGRINEQEARKIDKTAYKGIQHIGKLGVELTYEDILLGKVGFEQIETDAHGRAIRTLGRIPPHAGQNVHLYLDAKMQAIAEQALGRFKGAVIALDTRTGGILTFASTPTYDPNLFINGIDVESYNDLREDRNKPLINRALNGRYAPGSTIKPFYGLMGLDTAGFSADRKTVCTGAYSLPGSTHRFRCWKKEGHGAVDLHDAVVQSCDVYFYKLAVSSGPERMKTFLSSLGFGAKTGVDLGGESTGLVPSREWKRANNIPWYPGDTVIAGIGQGPILVTPLQLANSVSVIANRGHRLTPRLLHGTADPATKAVRYLDPEPLAPLSITDIKHFDTIIKSMTDVVHGAGGTAQRIGYNAPYKIAGKTGTAQVRSIAQGERYIESKVAEQFRDHALFIAFAPAEAPQIAVAVIVENGGHGGSVAAPIARRIMDYYITGKDTPPPPPAPARRPAAPSIPAAAPAAGDEVPETPELPDIPAPPPPAEEEGG